MTDSQNGTVVELTPEDVEAILETLEDGNRLADVAGVTQKQLEALYALGHSLYVAGRYEDSGTIFQGLCHYDYSDSRFWTGLGASLQGQSKYLEAIDVYSMAAMTTGLADPAPIYYAAQCYLKLNRTEEAIGALEGLSVMGEEGRADHEAIKSKAAGLLEVLKAGQA